MRAIRRAGIPDHSTSTVLEQMVVRRLFELLGLSGHTSGRGRTGRFSGPVADDLIRSIQNLDRVHASITSAISSCLMTIRARGLTPPTLTWISPLAGFDDAPFAFGIATVVLLQENVIKSSQDLGFSKSVVSKLILSDMDGSGVQDANFFSRPTKGLVVDEGEQSILEDLVDHYIADAFEVHCGLTNGRFDPWRPFREAFAGSGQADDPEIKAIWSRRSACSLEIIDFTCEAARRGLRSNDKRTGGGA